MRKVIGIGETVLDIIFKDNQPIGAVPGGSTYNGTVYQRDWQRPRGTDDYLVPEGERGERGVYQRVP